MGTKYIDGELRVVESIFEGGVSLASKYAKDSSVVHKGKDETITGNKTFNATNNYNGYNIFNGATNANGEKECITFPTGAILATDKELKLYTHNSYNTFGNSSGTYGLKGAANTVYDLATMVRSGVDNWGITGTKQWSDPHHFNNGVTFNAGTVFNDTAIFNKEISSTKLVNKNTIENYKGHIFGGHLEIHPDSNKIIIPFFENDLAFLQKKGGSCTISGFATGTDVESLFNGTPNYSYYSVKNLTDVVTILIKSPQNYLWTTRVGISFGGGAWRAKDIKIELGYAAEIGGDPADNAWVTVGETTDYSHTTFCTTNCNGPETGINGRPWNTIRITLTNFYGTNVRIAGIFAFNLQSNSLATTLLSKGGGEIYGDILPYKNTYCGLGNSTKQFGYGYIRSVNSSRLYPADGNNTGSIGDSSKIWNNVWADTNKNNWIMPITNNYGSVGSEATKWNSVNATYIKGTVLYEDGVALKNKYATEYKVALGRNTTEHEKTTCCSFLTLTFPDQWNTFYFNLTIKDSESRYFNSEYFIRGRASDTNTNLICEIQNVYSTNYNKSRWNIFATQNGNTMTFYVKTTDARYCSPDVFISKYSFGAIQIEAKAGTWTENIPTETWTELTNALDSRYAPRTGGTFTGDVRFDTVSWHANIRPTTSGGGSIGSEANLFHSMWAKYYYEDGVKLEEKYVPKKSINNAYQAIVDNSGAAFTVTAGLSNNTNQTILKIAPSGTATINDKQIATTDDIPSYGNATTTTSGLMSASDKTTLTALTCKSESKDIALGLTSLIGDQTVNPITANITDRSFFSKIIDLMRAGQVVTGFYLQLGNYYTFLKLFFANLEEGYENLSFEITDANDNSCVSYGINYDASNYIITFNKRDASIADALIDDNGTTYHYNSFALSSHSQASNTINAMTNYSKPTSTSAIKATDSLNTAIGKLEKALDGKGTSNLTLGTTATTAAKGDHTHSAATTSAAGLMSKDDKTKLNGITSGATKVEASTTNGKIKINGTETTVYTHPGSGTNPHGTTKTDIGLGNVGNFKAVSTVASQGLTSTEKSNARANIGAGTSSLTLGTTATTAAKGDHTHSAATTSAAGLMSAADKTKLDTISNNYVKEYNTGKNAMPGTIINNGSSIYIDSGNDSINVIGEGDEHGVSISVGDNNFVNFYQDRTEMIDAPVKIKQIQAPTTSNGTTYGLGTSGQVLKSNGTSVYWANDSTTTHTTFTRGSTDFSLSYTLTAKDAGFIHTWWRCSSNLYASCNFGKVIAVSATNLFPMQKYSPGINTSNQTTAYQKSVSSGSGSYSNNSANAFQIPQRGDMVIDQYGCIGVIESDPTTVVSTYSVRLVWKSIKDWSCLEKGTQITLADGTYKNIEDVRQGESIMGWDFEKNEPCEAIALFADAAQADEKTTYLVLDNGEILSMTDGHTLYSKNLERYIPINDLREGDILMGKDGEDVEVVSIHWNVHTFGIRQFYHIVSSNNTYFANNTLNAIHPVDKYNWLQNRSSEVVPDEILTIFEQDKGEFDCFDFTIKNKEFLALTSKHQSTLKKHRNKIGDLKNYLTNTDYVAIKMFEGLEVDETILDIRKEKRKEINALEAEIERIEKEYNNLLVQYSDLGEDMLLSDNARRSKYFKIACKNDNEHLDLFKKYYPLKDEAYILKEIEEGKANRPITETTIIEEESE